jgi:hypothetical protein
MPSAKRPTRSTAARPRPGASKASKAAKAAKPAKASKSAKASTATTSRKGARSTNAATIAGPTTGKNAIRSARPAASEKRVAAQAPTTASPSATVARGARAARGPARDTARYILELVGGGDTLVCVVDRAVWAWINDGGTPPESLVARYAPNKQAAARDEMGGMEDENDRAIDVAVGSPTRYPSSAAAQRAITKAGHTTEGEFAGYLY